MSTRENADDRLVWLAEIAGLAAQEGRVNPDTDDKG